MTRANLRTGLLIFTLAVMSLQVCGVRAEDEAQKSAPGQKPGKRLRTDSLADQLLVQLQAQNHGPDQFKDAWLQTLKDLVSLGPTALPELIAELDATDDNMMLRCLGFVLRAIDDKRAVPALIRAVPKTLQPAGSDMGLISHDPELLKFAQLHDYGQIDRDNYYSFGRPVNEILFALRKLTGKKFDEVELHSMSAGGFPSQQREKVKLFHGAAKLWADWWEQHWSEYVMDKTYSKVNLPLPSSPPEAWTLKPGMRFNRAGGGSNYLLESVFDLKAKTVFYDFDTGRHGRVPDKWRTAKARVEGQPTGRKSIEANMAEILAWAAGEGFDMLGTEYVSPSDGQRYFALRPIGMQVWQLENEKAMPQAPGFTLEQVQAAATERHEWLLPVDPKTNVVDPKGTALFLYVTREGTPGFVRVGIEVQDTNMKIGVRFDGDHELNPVHFHKGRRFGWTSLVEADPKKPVK